tara:strand:- start:2732 stop:4402 length:1671 start_codon:yes stop_codon:yes gene_type:complete
MDLFKKVLSTSWKSELLPSTLYAVRIGSDVDFYRISDNTLSHSFDALTNAGTTNFPSGIEISPDNSFFVTGGGSGRGAYSMEDGSAHLSISTTRWGQISISPDGNHIAMPDVTTDKFLIYETSGWTLVRTISTGWATTAVAMTAWSPDGSKIAVGNQSGYFRIYNFSDATAYSNEILSAGSSPVLNTIDFSPDGTLLATGNNENASGNAYIQVSVVQATMTEGDEFSLGPVLGGYTTALFTPDGKHLVLAQSGTSAASIRTYETTGWTVDTSSPITEVLANRMGISNDGTVLGIVGHWSPYVNLLNLPALTLQTGTPTLSAAARSIGFNHPIEVKNLEYIGGSTDTSATTYTHSFTSLTGGSASAPVEGDVVVLFHSYYDATGSTNSTIASGWTEAAVGPTSTDHHTKIYYKVMGSTPDTGVVMTCTVATGTIASVWKNADLNAIRDIPSVITEIASTPIPNPPSVTPITEGAVIIHMGGGHHDKVGTVFSTTDLTDFQEVIHGTYNNAYSAYKFWDGSGAFDAAVLGWTGTADGPGPYNAEVGYLVLKPAPRYET